MTSLSGSYDDLYFVVTFLGHRVGIVHPEANYA